MYNFCTLFDRNYLYKGLTLYFSLLKNCDNFHIWILCADELTFCLVKKMDLTNVSLIKIEDFENKKLLKVKKERTVTEYSWTLASSLCWYMLNKINDGEMITYLDADMYFFNSPDIIFEEIGDSSIAIVEHRLKGVRKKLEKYVGKYNVAWVSFRKDDDGLKASRWWKDKVLEWCGAYFSNGKIGDQHYLNDWTTRFKKVCVIKHEGADVAPWNINNCKIRVNNGIFISDVPLIFYHFHNFLLINNNKYISSTSYHIPFEAKKYIYKPYFLEIQKVINLIHAIDKDFNFGFKKRKIKRVIASLLFSCRFFDYLYINYNRYALKKTYK